MMQEDKKKNKMKTKSFSHMENYCFSTPYKYNNRVRVKFLVTVLLQFLLIV